MSGVSSMSVPVAKVTKGLKYHPRAFLFHFLRFWDGSHHCRQNRSKTAVVHERCPCGPCGPCVPGLSPKMPIECYEENNKASLTFEQVRRLPNVASCIRLTCNASEQP